MTLGNNESILDRCRAIDWRVALFLLLAALLALNAVVSRDTPIQGDGAEYFLMSQSLLTHGDPSLSKADMRAFDRALQQMVPGDRVQNLDFILQIIDAGSEWNGCYY